MGFGCCALLQHMSTLPHMSPKLEATQCHCVVGLVAPNVFGSCIFLTCDRMEHMLHLLNLPHMSSAVAFASHVTRWNKCLTCSNCLTCHRNVGCANNMISIVLQPLLPLALALPLV